MTDEAAVSPRPRWSLITVAYNSARILAKHWTTDLPEYVEWIVVDNASTDGSSDTASDLGATQVISLTQNLGFGAANNIGFASARGEFVAFVNPDVVVDFESLSAIEAALLREDGIVAPQLVYPTGEHQPSGRGMPSLSNKILARLGVRRVRDQYYIFVEPGRETLVPWVIGAAVAARREIFARIRSEGPWDPAFFVYYEDSDLGLRAWLNGYTTRVLGDVRWVHSWARDTARFRLKPWILEIRSARTFYLRYPQLIFTSSGGARFKGIREQFGWDGAGAASGEILFVKEGEKGEERR
ncbi:glycosyltransferase [Microbacterium tumbae]